ncbi:MULTISPECIES: phosphohistidine phosphatase SixA [unclassified Modicisalibacter]|uniref:phosphohistidine phosphatase SixA n=1 Tax=unclassified Modicisalibacter TaxID=2679913 RepID=UPI001CC9B664|nr:MULTISPECIES: phosphohistidine phosphatase SixA [unclassified Modicisalibacter]MBZ9560186.1 phosphohistidine phosphatase SixA [Modicisalibacter sp. R2A 31.J]MBZ9576094.1 phosphohistidine phosphatase SixA [Modicisalibacter sp. MOD 31.J]
MTATIWIMRHGEAAPGRPDHLRELTEHGRDEARRMAGWLAGSLSEAQRRALRIVASPYRRAQQTAGIVAESLGKDVETLASITPDDPVAPVIDWLQVEAAATPTLLVSHMPLVGELTGRLVEGDRRSSLPMPTAAIAALEAEVWAAGCADLVAFRHPGDLA